MASDRQIIPGAIVWPLSACAVTCLRLPPPLHRDRTALISDLRGARAMYWKCICYLWHNLGQSLATLWESLASHAASCAPPNGGCWCFHLHNCHVECFAQGTYPSRRVARLSLFKPSFRGWWEALAPLTTWHARGCTTSKPLLLNTNKQDHRENDHNSTLWRRNVSILPVVSQIDPTHITRLTDSMRRLKTIIFTPLALLNVASKLYGHILGNNSLGQNQFKTSCKRP